MEIDSKNNLKFGNFKKQMKRADKSGAQYALIIGENEIANNQVAIKPLRNNNEQQLVSRTELVAKIAELI